MAETTAGERERAIGLSWMESFWMDLRHGLRTLRKNPGFAAVAILTLALGIGANTAIFSAVNAVLLRPLPYSQPGQLVQLWETEIEVPQAPFAAPDFVDWRAQNQAFEDMALYTWPTSLNMSATGEPEHVYGILAQANFFSVLGSAPLIGRTFVAGEDRAGHNHVAVLSYGLWQRRLGGTRDALGIVLSGSLIALTLLSIETALVLVFDPRYRDLPFAPQSAGVIAFLALALFTSRPAGKRAAAETLAAAIIGVCAVYVAINETVANWQALWLCAGFIGLAFILSRARDARD